MPKRAIRACSSADSAVFDFPLRDRCQPSSSRLWQSITKAIVVQPSRPAQTRHISVAQRSLGALAAEGSDWIRGLKPTGRLRTCQPLSWKMRCTVFLLNPSRCATVRYPKDGFSSIMALIGATKCSFSVGAAFTGR
ncbi:hypothetical protein D9M69_679150 [compost metagenome]